MRIHNLLRMLTLTGVGLLISISNNAHAQFPTFDISAIKEGITSNIELVKQSKIVTDATATAGKINAGIGDAKASVSKFAGDNLEKAKEKAEKIKKEKERIEEKKKKYEKYKEELEAKKKQMEDAKARVEKAKADAEKYKSDIESGVADAKEMAADAKGMAADAKEMAAGAKDMASSKISNAKSQAGISQNSGTTSPAAMPAQVEVPVPNSNNKNYEPSMQQLPMAMEQAPMLAEAAETVPVSQEERDALDHERAELEVDAMLAQTPEEKAAIEEKKKDLQVRMDALEANSAAPVVGETVPAPVSNEQGALGRRPFGTQALKVSAEAKADVKAAPQTASEEKTADKEMPAPKRAKILDGETSSDANIEPQDFHRAKILDTYQAPEDHRPKILDQVNQPQKAPAAGGFRKRAVPMKSSSLETITERKFVRSFSETLVFAQAGMDEMPDGVQDGVFIIADRMARECEVNVKDLEDQKVMDDCIKKLVALKSSKESSIAQEGGAIYRSIMQETVNALTAESMSEKNIAATYEQKVLEKLEKDIANTKNSRDDTGGLAMTNKELQYLLNRVLKIYSSQLMLNALQQIGGFDSSYYSQDGHVDDSSSGEK